MGDCVIPAPLGCNPAEMTALVLSLGVVAHICKYELMVLEYVEVDERLRREVGPWKRALG